MSKTMKIYFWRDNTLSLGGFTIHLVCALLVGVVAGQLLYWLVF